MTPVSPKGNTGEGAGACPSCEGRRHSITSPLQGPSGGFGTLLKVTSAVLYDVLSPAPATRTSSNGFFFLLYCCKNGCIFWTHSWSCFLYSPVDKRCKQHLGRPEDGSAGSERGVATGTTRLPGTNPAVCKGQSIMGGWKEWAEEPCCSGKTGNKSKMFLFAGEKKPSPEFNFSFL